MKLPQSLSREAKGERSFKLRFPTLHIYNLTDDCSHGDFMPAIDPLLISVSKIIASSKKGTEYHHATGFFYQHAEGLYLITNRHVVIVEDDDYRPDELILRLHTNAGDIRENAPYRIPLYDDTIQVWSEHPRGAEVDLVAIWLDVGIRSRFIINPFTMNDFAPPSVEFPIGQDLIVMGYPKGYHDQFNNFPLVRNALVSSVYGLNFNRKPYFLIDSHLHEGTSGSPVLTTPSNMTHGSDGSLMISGVQRRFLIGVNSATVDVEKTEEGDESEDKYEDPLGLSAVWYARLIPEIITQCEMG